MPDIPFTQFLRPDGRRRAELIDRPQPIYEKARAIIAAGFQFECEELMSGHASFTISDHEGDWAHGICMNGPAVPGTVDRMIEQFDLVEQVSAKEERERC